MTTNQNNAENTQQIAENKKCTLKNRCVNLLCIMSFGNETFQNTNDRYSKFENIVMYVYLYMSFNDQRSPKSISASPAK